MVKNVAVKKGRRMYRSLRSLIIGDIEIDVNSNTNSIKMNDEISRTDEMERIKMSNKVVVWSRNP
jgi:hypothetical protein